MEGQQIKRMHLYSLPTPFSVLGIMREPPHIEIRFYDFWSQYVVLFALSHCLRLGRTVKTE